MTAADTARNADSEVLPPVDREVIAQAARWMARLWSEQVTASDVAACNQWRSQRREHELAWQRMQAVGEKFAAVPDRAGRHALKVAPQTQSQMRRNSLKILGATLFIGVAAELGRRSDAWQQLAADYTSGVGEIRNVTLPDGTQLVLNTNSAVDIRYTGDARRIMLRAGEIMVTTARDSVTPHRPLTVTGRDGEVRALGTRFVVRQQDRRSSVAVFEGAVEVRPRQLATVLRVDAGYQADYAQDAVAQIETLDDSVGNWSQGLLVAEQMPLSRFVEEIGRYRHGVLRCAPDIAGLKVSGVFSLRDTDRALSNLTLGLPVQVRYRTRYWVTVVPRPG